LSDFTVVGCGVVFDSFQLLKTPSAAVLAAAGGTYLNIVAAAAPAGAVWVRTFQRNGSASYGTAWFLDAAAGSDSNDGLTIGTPLRTLRELSNRLRGATLLSNVTVTLAAGNYGADPVSFDLEIAAGVSLLMVGAVSSTADVAVTILPTVKGTAATNAGAQRGTLTGTTFNFTAAANDRQRLTMTSGAAIGAMAFITRVPTPGVGGVVNLTRWGIMASPRTNTIVTNSTPANGDSYRVDTLNSQIGYIDIRVRGPGRFVIQDCLVRSTSASSVTNRAICDNGNVNGVLAYGCIFQAASALLFQQGNWTMAVCSLSSDGANVVFASSIFAVMRMCVVTGTTAQPLCNFFLQGSSQIQIDEGICFDNVSIVLESGSVMNQIGGTNNDAQVVDGNGVHAIELAQGTLWWAHSATDLIWGLDNAFTGTTVLVDAGAYFYYGAKPSIPGGTGTDFSVAGTTGNWAALPIVKTTTPGALTAFSS
jgi:hypothetical protein